MTSPARFGTLGGVPPTGGAMRKLAALLAALPLAAFAQPGGDPAAAPPPAAATPTAAEPAAATPAPAPQAQAQAPAPYPPPPHALPPAPPAAPTPAAGPPRGAKERDGWYIGFAVGGLGNARIELEDGIADSFAGYAGDDTAQLFLNFKVGATLTPRLLLGFDLTSMYAAWDGPGTEGLATVSNYDAVVTFFPARKGLFVRGGLGLATFSYDAEWMRYTEDPEPHVAPTSGSGSATGLSLLAGVGYAFWLGRSFNLTLNLDVSRQGYGARDDDPLGMVPEASTLWALYAGFDWY
jgi:hypothetical protein